MPPLKTLFCQKQKYSAILRLAVPLILSSSGIVVMQFVDAIFLAWYSPDALAASGTGGMLNWLVASFVVGTVGYTSVITANYIGAKMDAKVGPAIWQGIHIAFIAGIITFLLSFATEPFFNLCGHSKRLVYLESRYFDILMKGGIIAFARTALTGFFSGRGDNVRMMLALVAGQITNILGDWILIFGKCGFPQLGIQGAALATVLSEIVPITIMAAMFLTRRNRIQYDTWNGRKFYPTILTSLLKYGLPSGFQSFVDAAIWSLFLLFVGRIGTIELGATSAAFRINNISFMPVIGLSQATSTFVGQAHGRRNHPETLQFACHGLALSQLWMTVIAITYILIPRQYMAFFGNPNAPQYAELMDTGTHLLRFVALYTLADGINISLCGTLQAVGDTKWTSKVMCIATAILALMLCIAAYLNWSLYVIWMLATVYIIVMPPFWLIRIRAGQWKHIVIAK